MATSLDRYYDVQDKNSTFPKVLYYRIDKETKKPLMTHADPEKMVEWMLEVEKRITALETGKGVNKQK